MYVLTHCLWFALRLMLVFLTLGHLLDFMVGFMLSQRLKCYQLANLISYGGILLVFLTMGQPLANLMLL